ncbi:hypothetical protein, variant 2 [Phytophthora nicotianae]|uniref:WLGC domain-containing protein n=2 Tax=Phytophthora nicotianae TaxID=4792 RepID=V9EP32_PHYNI|nr:hypothetical protein F443_14301 [Phytophthora nicotianae P1569]ETL33786.1 hypothetical protein L916_13838 [Phytophthora nicotianae]ETI40258.1 hypothetical protein, variant 1 [Phytophthora nicotianae P1569]ETI40259.1 hypothetical protein, variant 2 [Phytophthora nicotianae P1569]ETL33787.1 hypothetical protein, variant 1 [Phytophthora nicotianae]
MSDQDRKLWLDKATPTAQKLSYAGTHHHYEERNPSIFSKIFHSPKVAPSPHLDLVPALVSTQATPQRVVPWRSQRNDKERRKSTETVQIPAGLTFRQTFGALGIPLLVVVVVCILWTSLLIFITVAPNEAANLIMNTGDYDNGSFWLIVEHPPTLKWISVAGLVLVNACYIIVLVRILRYHHTAVGICQPSWNSAVAAAWDSLSSCWLLRCTPAVKSKLQNIYRIYTELTGFNAINRKLFNIFQKACDLVVQGLALRRLLNQGLPIVFGYGYASFIALNGLSVAVNIMLDKHTAFTEVLIDSVFDLTAAVVYPIAVLGYCYHNFSFDRDVYLVNAEILPDGNFERYARMQADPAEVALFLVNFNSLRISGVLDFILSVGLNLSFCYRFVRVIAVIISQRCQLRSTRPVSPQKLTEVTKRQKSVPRLVALAFIAASICAIVLTHTAITSSRAACETYPECVAYAHIWDTGNQCPCIVIIDGDRAPRTAQEWNFPEDMTDTVRALAEAGRLHTLQLINRQLRRWPDELRRCKDMKTISLIYTSIEEIPSWAKEFKQLQHLHLEGKFGSRNLVTLPSDIFSDLPEFTFLHLGNHHSLVALPAFDGTPNLRSMVLAVLLSLTELPSFDNLPNLETMALAHIQQVPAVPDMSPLISLSRLAIFRPNHMCCNGFMGICDLTDTFCVPDLAYNVPGASCLDSDDHRHATTATKALLARFSVAVCQKSIIPFSLERLSDFPAPDRIAACDGVMYRQCDIPGVTSVNGTVGMCYSSRMQVVACNVDQLFIKVRQVEIERGVGPPCDPEVEAWLGCKKATSS